MAGLRRMVGGLLDAVDRQDRVRRLRTRWKARLDPRNAFLRQASGVIHVGANTGQERQLYDDFGLRVLWVEPIPEVFQELVANIGGYPKQMAKQALVTDADGQLCKFHVANNGGASSSMLDLHEHRDIWPDIDFCADIELTSVTLDTLVADLDEAYDALIMDTQGTELFVLRGATNTLKGMRYIMVEAADFEAYRDCATVDQIGDFLTPLGYALVRKELIAARSAGGAYYDLLFRRG
jgi:FkbM family methyltransferase